MGLSINAKICILYNFVHFLKAYDFMKITWRENKFGILITKNSKFDFPGMCTQFHKSNIHEILCLYMLHILTSKNSQNLNFFRTAILNNVSDPITQNLLCQQQKYSRVKRDLQITMWPRGVFVLHKGILPYSSPLRLGLILGRVENIVIVVKLKIIHFT